MILLLIVTVHLAFTWILLRILVPYMGFKKDPFPVEIPEHINIISAEIKNSSNNQAEALKNSYEYVTSTYQGSREKTVLQFWKAFGSPFTKKSGFLPCNMQNQLLRVLLVQSGYFKDSDIKFRVTPLNLFIHQYLQVQIGNNYIDVDPWSHFLGTKIGEKASMLA